MFLRHPVTGKFMGIIHHFRPCMDWGGTATVVRDGDVAEEKE